MADQTDTPQLEEGLERDTSRALAIALLRAREKVVARFRPLLTSEGMTEQQWRVLRVLGEHDTLDASRLAERTCILAPSLTRIIRSLEAREMISVARDASDGRRLLLSLAPAGQAILDKLGPASRRIYRDIEEQFGAANVQRLLDQLNALSDLPDRS